MFDGIAVGVKKYMIETGGIFTLGQNGEHAQRRNQQSLLVPLPFSFDGGV